MSIYLTLSFELGHGVFHLSGRSAGHLDVFAIALRPWTRGVGEISRQLVCLSAFRVTNRHRAFASSEIGVLLHQQRQRLSQPLDVSRRLKHLGDARRQQRRLRSIQIVHARAVGHESVRGDHVQQIIRHSQRRGRHLAR